MQNQIAYVATPSWKETSFEQLELLISYQKMLILGTFFFSRYSGRGPRSDEKKSAA